MACRCHDGGRLDSEVFSKAGVLLHGVVSGHSTHSQGVQTAWRGRGLMYHKSGV
jgi:hypothetical protein